MITIHYDIDNGAQELRVTGHSGSAPKGQDLICAAVTILVRTLEDMLQRHGTLRSAFIKEGNARIVGDTLDEAWESCMCGIGLLIRQYPNYICMKSPLYEKFIKSCGGGAYK